MIEKRKFTRLTEPLIIRYYVIGGGTGVPYQLKEAEVVDSSEGGVCLKTDEGLEEGSVLEMELMLPLRAGAETFKRAVVMGEVVRVTKSGGGDANEYGVRFIHVDEDMKQEIARFMATRLANQPENAGGA